MNDFRENDKKNKIRERPSIVDKIKLIMREIFHSTKYEY